MARRNDEFLAAAALAEIGYQERLLRCLDHEMARIREETKFGGASTDAKAPIQLKPQ
jgi:hypothetical protein